MTKEFINNYCVDCICCIFEKPAYEYFYSYYDDNNWKPMFCGVISEDGVEVHYELTKLVKCCRNYDRS